MKQKKAGNSRKSKNRKQNKNKGRKPKQFEKDGVKADFDEDDEPTPEPEPSGGHHGDPRHHAFHSCKYNLYDCLWFNIVTL